MGETIKEKDQKKKRTIRNNNKINSEQTIDFESINETDDHAHSTPSLRANNRALSIKSFTLIAGILSCILISILAFTKSLFFANTVIYLQKTSSNAILIPLESTQRFSLNQLKLILNRYMPKSSSFQQQNDDDQPLVATTVCYITEREEHLCVMGPVCIDHGTLVLPSSDNPRCIFIGKAGEEREMKDVWACKRRLKRFYTEAEFDGQRTELKDDSWFRSAKLRGIARMYSLTVALMQLKDPSTNIAHFGGRVMFFQHALSYAQTLYGVGLDAIVLRMSERVWNRTFSEQVDSWQQGMLRMIAFPLPLLPAVTDSTPPEQMELRGVHIMADGQGFPSNTVCYRRAILPAFLKGRFFIPESEVVDPGATGKPLQRDDSELFHALSGRNHPQNESSGDVDWESKWKSANLSTEMRLIKSNYYVRSLEPRDAHVMREKWSLALNLERNENPFELVYLARYGRRQLSWISEWRLESMLKEVAKANNLKFQRIVFQEMTTFREQMIAIQNAVVAVGLHGANLVNSVFMDSRSSLVEIFPFGFEHDMYRQASGSGLGYYTTTVLRGKDYKNLRLFASRRDCMNRDPDCKLWYRSDHRTISLSHTDLIVIRAAIRSAIAYSRKRMLESVASRSKHP